MQKDNGLLIINGTAPVLQIGRNAKEQQVAELRIVVVGRGRSQANDLEINVQLNEGSSQVAYSILQAPSLQPFGHQ